MRNRHALFAATTTMALAILLSPNIWGQENRAAAGRDDKNQSGKHDEKQSSTKCEKIQGIVAGITAEGEVTFDYAHNRAIAAEGAFLTIVGSPVWSEKERSEHADKARADEKRGESGRRRHNVYIAWLSPRTKICECMEESGGSHAAKHEDKKAEAGKSNASNHESDKGRSKECSFDKLEIGDRVEIQFEPREESSGSHMAHQTNRMREKHGRLRTHVGIATEVTIMTSRDEEHSGSKDKDSK
ncbi:MAG: hypothetical protein ACLQGP_35455 [Isosphaeraceae bacterium]